MQPARAVATIVLTAACWIVWQHAPEVLAAVGLDDLDVPGRVLALFLFLTAAEALLGWLGRWRNATGGANQ